MAQGREKRVRGFPDRRSGDLSRPLTIAAEGSKADIAKPMTGMGSGVFEIALKFQGNAFRVMYAVQIDDDLWVLHAFQKKSKTGIKTPQQDVDLIKERLKRLKEVLP